ncbi:hypothetical protein C1H46_034187 [Malus baccata]|uniref:Uncharacterized protein n=1 Tax=Malus baccata TaxID=106549 RepID=A0A540L1T8_MALBA|nr:hypothetical protein C1H46_034187 [Malus baccata]
MRWAVGGRGVVSKDWRFAVCVPEVVLENVLGAGLGFGEFYGFGYFEVESWCGSVLWGGLGEELRSEKVDFVDIGGGKEWLVEEEEEEEGQRRGHE